MMSRFHIGTLNNFLVGQVHVRDNKLHHSECVIKQSCQGYDSHHLNLWAGTRVWCRTTPLMIRNGIVACKASQSMYCSAVALVFSPSSIKSISFIKWYGLVLPFPTCSLSASILLALSPFGIACSYSFFH